MHEITEEQALDRLRAKIGYHVKIKDLANEYSVSAAFMSDVLAGKKGMTEPMLCTIGVVKKISYFDLPDEEASQDG